MTNARDRKNRLVRVLTGARARSSSWALLGQVAAVVASTANFLLLARLVGPSEYGAIAGSLALVLTIGPFATLGADKLVVRDTATAPEAAPAALAAGLTTVVGGAAIATVVLVGVHDFVLPQVPLALLLGLAVAELVGNASMSCCVGSRFATGNARAGGLTMVTRSMAKIAAVVIFALTDGRDPVRWAMLYASLSLITAVVETTWAFAQVGRPSLVGYRPLAHAREGLPYSANVTATIAQNDVDKTLLVRSGFAQEAGLYSVAYRLATIAWLPLLAVLQSTFPRFFEIGDNDGLPGTARLARRLAKPMAVYALVACVVLVAGAPLIPLLVGEQYRGSVPLLMLLAPLALFKVAQYAPSDALTGAGRQGTRTACIIASTVLNVAINLMFIPRYGLAAALVATFLAELSYAVLVNLAVRRGLAQAAQAQTAGAGGAT